MKKFDKNNKTKTRNELVLEIIKTDNTFSLHTFKDGEQFWVGKCIHCNARMTVCIDGNTCFTIEHINPRIAGGTHDIHNLALACGSCNNEKGIRHDRFIGKNARSTEVINSLVEKRKLRWR